MLNQRTFRLAVLLLVPVTTVSADEVLHWTASGIVDSEMENEPGVDCFPRLFQSWNAEVVTASFSEPNFHRIGYMTFTVGETTILDGSLYKDRALVGSIVEATDSHIEIDRLRLPDGTNASGYVPANNSSLSRLHLSGCNLHLNVTASNAARQIFLGDANLDGQFNSSDLVQVFIEAKYAKLVKANWSQGDWNFDNLFTTSNLVVAFQAGNYTPEAITVPEPMAWQLLIPVVYFFARNLTIG
jgi:hypothetical protein